MVVYCSVWLSVVVVVVCSFGGCMWLYVVCVVVCGCLRLCVLVCGCV